MNEHERVMCRKCGEPVDCVEWPIDVFDTPNTFTILIHCHGETERRTIDIGRSGAIGAMLARHLIVSAFGDKQ